MPLRTRPSSLAGLAGASLLIAALGAAPGAHAAGPEISEFTLDNGLQVVVIPDRRAPVVTHMLWYKVGSADETAGETGIAHFLEHLMFKGTEANPIGTFSTAIAEIGGRENAFTSYDYTAYFQQVEPGALQQMMAFEADRMQNLVLSDEHVLPERDVVIEERGSRVENIPSSILDEELSATLYQNHPYGKPVIGWMHEIETLDREQALEFYRRHYMPNNAVLVVAGDVEAGEVLELAEQTYGAVPSGTAIERVRPREPEQKTRRTVTLTDPRVGVPAFRTAWVVPSYTTAGDDEAVALDLLAEILGGGVRSRLYQELVVRQGIAASAGAYYQGTALDDSTFGVYGSPRGEATLEDLEQAVYAEIARIVADGVTEEEMERVRRRAKRSAIFALDSQTGMARIYGAALTTGGTVSDVREWPERVERATADQVRAAAARHLVQRRAVTGYLLPENEG